MGQSTNTFYWLIAQRDTGLQDRKGRFYLRGRWCTIELNYNGAHRGGSCASFSLKTSLESLSIVINVIQNMSGLNIECGMSAGCNSVSDWRSSAKTVTFFGLENYVIRFHIRASFSPLMED